MSALRPPPAFLNHLFSFLLLASSTLVVVLVLVATRYYYPTFGGPGRALAWAIAFGGVLALGSLSTILVRLYVQPVLHNGARRRKRNA